MSAALPDLLRDLERALTRQDLDAASSVRRTIVQAHPETEAGGEASYKLGLEALFVRRDMEQAGEHFRRGTKVKGRWGGLCRSALALVLLRQGKSQQAIFELRRVAGATPPTMLSASALGLLSLALREIKQTKEAEKVRGDHMKVLAKLAEGPAGEDRALAAFMLGMEHKFNGERDPARRYLRRAVEDPALPAEERAQAEQALGEV